MSASAVRAQDRPIQSDFRTGFLRRIQTPPPLPGPTIDKASNGSIKIAIFPSQQLGRAFDHYNMARDGIADVSHVNPGYEPGRFPIIGVAELPFLFSNGRKEARPSMRGIAATPSGR